jgi:hypothetical protein
MVYTSDEYDRVARVPSGKVKGSRPRKPACEGVHGGRATREVARSNHFSNLDGISKNQRISLCSASTVTPLTAAESP